MLKVGLLCGVIAAMSATGVKANLDSKINSKTCDTEFIVELNDDIDNISAKTAEQQQNAILRKIRRTVNATSKKVTSFKILNNAIVVTGNKLDKEAISKLPGVKYVTENATHIVKKSDGFISLDTSSYKTGGASGEIDLTQNASAKTMNLPEGELTNEGEGTLIAVLDNEFFLRGKHNDPVTGNEVEAYYHETYTALPSGTKQRLTAAKVKGLNLPHAGKPTKPSGYEGSFYFNTKVPFYYDYAGDSENGSSYELKHDYNVESDVSLHGSHVSSIAAGNADGYKGIAPKAQLVLMKVFSDVKSTPLGDAAKLGDYSTFSEVGFVEAMEDCIELGVDAINVSIGSDLDDFDSQSISMRTISKIVEKGILTSISAGNAGKASYAFTGAAANWTKDVVETGILGSYANNVDSMSIASGQPEWTFYEDSFAMGDRVVPYNDQIVNREGQAETYPDNEHRFVELINGGDSDPDTDPTSDEQDIDLDYVYVKGFGEEKDYKSLDVSDKIVVCNRGKINFSEKYANAENHGAKALIIVNNDPTESDFTFTCDFGDAAKSIRFPVALVLFKDKPYFEENPTGTFKIKKNTSSINPLSRTVSDFSSDGATFDLDLKPEITTPGSNIKGAVWPQNKKEKRPENYYSSYEYFNGTSMAAPNYEGAMAVVLSKLAKSETDRSKVEAFRDTINMRFTSTAIPMSDAEPNQENNVVTLTSPRMQGAGMANIKGAYNTSVYLEGVDAEGNGLKKAKINLKNNADIAQGKVKLSFLAHNESDKAQSYDVSFNVMRPATAYTNKVLTSDYNTPVEADSILSFAGHAYFSPEEEKNTYVEGTANYKDVLKVTKDITYYENAEQYAADTPLGVIKEGMYYCADENPDWTKGITWKEVPNYEYQSIQDIEIAKVDCGSITVNAKEDKLIELDEYSLTEEAKARIAELYEAGTYIEGFVSLKAKEVDGVDLSIPYLGFYSLADKNAGASYSNAPVVEPFSFEKDKSKIYGSDLINDVTKSLLGKDQVNFGSMMLTGYSQRLDEIDTDKVLTNDLSFEDFAGFKSVGIIPDPYKNEYTENPANDIYVGNPNKSNTLIVQQFVLRSVKDNFISIKNKATAEEVYHSSLTDMLFGTKELYKSHVDGDYLGGGYVAHRAYALIPLYDLKTRAPFASGDYSLEFNYQLAGTGEWVKKIYTLHVDTESPVVSSIIDFKDGKKDMVRITYKDTRAAYAIVGSTQVAVNYDSKTGNYYSDVEKEIIDAAVSGSKKTSFSDSRLFLRVYDFARGETTAIVHFDGDDYSHFTIVQGQGFTNMTDFKYVDDKLTLIELDKSNHEHEISTNDAVIIINGVPAEAQKSGASPLVLGLSIGGGVLVLGGAGVLVFFLLKKKKGLGGK